MSKKSDLENCVNKAMVLGCAEPLKCSSTEVIYLITKSDNEHIIYVPDNIEYLSDKCEGEFLDLSPLCKRLRKLRGTIRLVGGKGLKSIKYLFCRCECECIDLSSFTFDNITEIRYLFDGCEAQSIIFSGVNISNVQIMESMFRGCKCNNLVLDDLDISNVTDMRDMFAFSKIENLYLNNWDLSTVDNIDRIFYRCNISVHSNIDATKYIIINNGFSLVKQELVKESKLWH